MPPVFPRVFEPFCPQLMEFKRERTHGIKRLYPGNQHIVLRTNAHMKTRAGFRWWWRWMLKKNNWLNLFYLIENDFMTFDFIILKNFRASSEFHSLDHQFSLENVLSVFQRAALKGEFSSNQGVLEPFTILSDVTQSVFRSVNGIQIKTLQDEYGRFKVNNIGIYSDFAKP